MVEIVDFALATHDAARQQGVTLVEPLHNDGTVPEAVAVDEVTNNPLMQPTAEAEQSDYPYEEWRMRTMPAVAGVAFAGLGLRGFLHRLFS